MFSQLMIAYTEHSFLRKSSRSKSHRRSLIEPTSIEDQSTRTLLHLLPVLRIQVRAIWVLPCDHLLDHCSLNLRRHLKSARSLNTHHLNQGHLHNNLLRETRLTRIPYPSVHSTNQHPPPRNPISPQTNPHGPHLLSNPPERVRA